MDLRREEAIQHLMAAMPTMETFIPTMVDACNPGARREQVIEVLSAGPFTSTFEAKYRAALAFLSTEEIEEVAALFATPPTLRLTALLKWASGLAWAATEVKVYIDREYDRLLSEGLK